MLQESPNEVKRYLSQTDLTLETFFFTGQILLDQSGRSEKIKDNLQSSLVSIIHETREKSSRNKQLAHLATAAINLYYSAWGELPRIKWDNLVLNNAHLPEADFTGQNLFNTSLQNANLDNANFTDAILAHCDMTGVKFEETKDVCAMQMVLLEKIYLFALYSDGKVRKWDLSNNHQIEIMSELAINVTEKFGIGRCDFGTVFFRNDRVYFTNHIQAGIKICGGVHFTEDITIFDLQQDRILFSTNQQLALYNLREQTYIFQNYPVTKKTKAILMDVSSAFLFGDDAGFRIVTTNNDVKNIDTYLREDDCRNTTTASVFIYHDNTFRICIGYESGKLSLFELDDSLKEIACYYHEKYVKSVCFLDSLQIAFNSADGIIHVLQLADNNELQKRKPLRLAVRCKGAILECVEKGVIYHVKQQEQYEKLRDYLDI